MTPQREALNKLIAMAAADEAQGVDRHERVADEWKAADLLAQIARAAHVATVVNSQTGDDGGEAHQRLADLVETILYVVGDIYGIEWKADNDG